MAVPWCHILDVIAFPYMTQYAIHREFSSRISDIFLFCIRVLCVPFFWFSVVIVGLRAVVIGWRLFRLWSNCSPVHGYSIAYTVFFNRHSRWRHFNQVKKSKAGRYKLAIQISLQAPCLGYCDRWSVEVNLLPVFNFLWCGAYSCIVVVLTTALHRFHSYVHVLPHCR